jgi:hypothetical protein
MKFNLMSEKVCKNHYKLFIFLSYKKGNLSYVLSNSLENIVRLQL